MVYCCFTHIDLINVSTPAPGLTNHDLIFLGAPQIVIIWYLDRTPQ